MKNPSEVSVEERKVIHLTYDESDYPGWEPGDVIASPLTGPDGTVYQFSGTATVGGVVLNAGKQYDVQLAHVPDNDDKTVN